MLFALLKKHPTHLNYLGDFFENANNISLNLFSYLYHIHNISLNLFSHLYHMQRHKEGVVGHFWNVKAVPLITWGYGLKS